MESSLITTTHAPCRQLSAVGGADRFPVTNHSALCPLCVFIMERLWKGQVLCTSTSVTGKEKFKVSSPVKLVSHYNGPTTRHSTHGAGYQPIPSPLPSHGYINVHQQNFLHKNFLFYISLAITASQQVLSSFSFRHPVQRRQKNNITSTVSLYSTTLYSQETCNGILHFNNYCAHYNYLYGKQGTSLLAEWAPHSRKFSVCCMSCSK